MAGEKELVGAGGVALVNDPIENKVRVVADPAVVAMLSALFDSSAPDLGTGLLRHGRSVSYVSGSLGAYLNDLLDFMDSGGGGGGAPGAAAYLHIRYSDDGGVTFTGGGGVVPGAYIGTYSDAVPTASASVSAYTWALIRGAPGASGNYTDYVFKRAATQPTTPTGNGTPATWFGEPPAADGNPLWMTRGVKTPANVLVGTWATPVRLDGTNGAAGSSITVEYSQDGATAWHSTFATGDLYMRQKVGAGAFSQAIRIVGEDGADGTGMVTLIARGNCVVSGPDRAHKVGGVSEWDSEVRSLESYTGGAFVSFQCDQSNLNLMVGLNSDPTTDLNFTSLDWAWFCDGGISYLFHDGALLQTIGSYTSNTVFSIIYNNQTVRFFADGVLAGEYGDTQNKRFYLDSSFEAPGGSIRNVRFGPVGAAGAAGTSPVTGWLSNEACTVAADSAGAVASFSGAGGNFRVFNGNTEVTTGNSVAYSVLSSSGVTIAINGSTGVYTVSAMSADSGTATLRAIFGSTAVDRAYSIAKSKAGAAGSAGANAQVLTLLSTGQAFKYDTTGAPSPSSQTLSFTAQLANLSGTAAFTCTLYDASGTSIGTPTMGGSGNTRTLTNTQFNNADSAVVQATLSGFTDRVTVYRLRDGAQGPQGVQGNQGIQGPAGANGQPSYFHMAFATSSDGSAGFNFSTGPYIGIYVDSTLANSNDYHAYTWRQFQGAQGPQGLQGIPGLNGATGQAQYIHIKYSNDGGTTFTSNAGEDSGIYIGLRVDLVSSDSNVPSDYQWAMFRGAQGPQGVAGPTGANGQPSYTHFKFSNDGGATFTGNQGEDVGRYLGICSDANLADPTVVGAYTWVLVKGADGTNGVQGPPGANGVSQYTHFKWSDDGGATFTGNAGEDPGRWLGIAVDNNVADPTTVGAYTWAPVAATALPGPKSASYDVTSSTSPGSGPGTIPAQTAQIRLNPNGTAEVSFGPSGSAWSSAGTWHSAPFSNVGANYNVKAVLLNGSALNIGALNTSQSLSSTRAFGISSTGTRFQVVEVDTLCQVLITSASTGELMATLVVHFNLLIDRS
jgi:hypothetical protein